MYSKVDVETHFEKNKIKSLVAWSISEVKVDQKQIINFVWPNIVQKLEHCSIYHNK